MLALPIFISLVIINADAGEIVPWNTLSCPGDLKCTIIDHCPSVNLLMSRNELPVHRFRQSICGYHEVMPKVCCNIAGRSAIDAYSSGVVPPVWDPKSSVQCGRSLIRSNVETLGTYPFVAKIGFINIITRDIKYPCAGTIINERTVLTTASCALATTSTHKLFSVLIGEYNMETEPDCNSLFCGHMTETYNISYVVKYPSYNADTFSNNVALLRLFKPIRYTVTAQPICFLPEDRYVPTGSNTIMVGWGRLSRQRAKSPIQQWLNMKLLPKQECSSFINQGLSVETCAVGEQVPCSGYSGSPLLYQYGDTYFLVGILSYGCDCDANINLPSVFVNAQMYTRWIQENS